MVKASWLLMQIAQPLCLVVQMLALGKIGAVITGNSEVGPRALGNRSIICDPTIKNMKDRINNKVKFRDNFA